MKLGAMNNPRMHLMKEIERIAGLGLDFIDLTIEAPAATPEGKTVFVMVGCGLNGRDAVCPSGFESTTVVAHGTAAGIANVTTVPVRVKTVAGMPPTATVHDGRKF